MLKEHIKKTVTPFLSNKCFVMETRCSMGNIKMKFLSLEKAFKQWWRFWILISPVFVSV